MTAGPTGWQLPDAVRSTQSSPVRLRLALAYDGTDFAGWAEQPGQRTIAGELRPVLELLSHGPVHLVVAGRTDAGVHAAAQIAHVDVREWGSVSLRALNGLLPPDVRVHAVEDAPVGFHARFSALSRRYDYRVSDSAPDPLRRRDTLAWPRPLELAAMTAASEQLLGLRDFTAFCRRREGRTATRRLLTFDWSRVETPGLLLATVVADAFCHSLVRSLVGAVLAVGDGRRPPDWPASMLGADARADDVMVAPARGLTLLEVRYPPAAELAARAEETRARRC